MAMLAGIGCFKEPWAFWSEKHLHIHSLGHCTAYLSTQYGKWFATAAGKQDDDYYEKRIYFFLFQTGRLTYKHCKLLLACKLFGV